MKLQVMLSWVQVEDLEKAKKFYGETLGLQKSFEMQGWAEYSHAKGAASIGLNPSPHNPGAAGVLGGAVIVLGVDDLGQAQKELSGRGVKFEGKVEEVPGVVRIATFRDPFGNRLQLCQSLIQG